MELDKKLHKFLKIIRSSTNEQLHWRKISLKLTQTSCLLPRKQESFDEYTSLQESFDEYTSLQEYILKLNSEKTIDEMGCV